MTIKSMPINRMLVDSRRPRLREKGFTLVEVVCSIFIAGIAASVLFIGFDNGFALLRTTREDLRATQILMQKTEAVRLLTWDQLTQGQMKFVEYFNPAGVSKTNGGTAYWCDINTTGVPTNIPSSAAYRSNIRLVTISVLWTNSVNDWKGARNISHSRQMQTLSAISGMQNYLAEVSTNK